MKPCDAILQHPDGKRFVMCELEEGHGAFHQALNMAWFGKGLTKADPNDWEKAKQSLFDEFKERMEAKP